MRKIIDLNTVADGALLDKVNKAMQQVVDNIADLNTDPTKMRKVTITISMKPNEERDLIQMEIKAVPSLAPAKGTNTKFLIGEDNGGVTAAEMKSGMPGQMFIDKDGDVSTDKGEKIEKVESNKSVDEKVVSFK